MRPLLGLFIPFRLYTWARLFLRPDQTTIMARSIAFREALREAMVEEMRRDDRVFLMGEEVAEYNGFGIAIAAARIDGHTGQTDGRIDDVTITIFFDQPSTLPVSLINFSAKKNHSSINLTWTTDDEANMSHYELQRSADGRNFSTIVSVQSKNNFSRSSYTAVDNKPINGIGYYRLKMVETDGSANYSRIVTVQSATGNAITVYPTLWKKGSALNISNPNNEKLDAHFFNSTGQYIGRATTINSTLPANTLNNQKGTIYFKIINANGLQLGKGSLLID